MLPIFTTRASLQTMHRIGKCTLEKTEGAIRNRHSIERENIGHRTQTQIKEYCDNYMDVCFGLCILLICSKLPFMRKKCGFLLNTMQFFSDLRINIVFESFCTISYPHIRIGITHKQESWV